MIHIIFIKKMHEGLVCAARVVRNKETQSKDVAWVNDIFPDVFLSLMFIFDITQRWQFLEEYKYG